MKLFNTEEIPIPNYSEALIFRSKQNGFLYYKLNTGESRLVKVENGIFSIPDKTITRVINYTDENVESVILSDGILLRFYLVPNVVIGGGGGSRGPQGPQGADGNTGASAWLLNGNTNGVEKYIGTNDNFNFPFRTNNIDRGRILKTGQFAIGPDDSASDFKIAILNIGADIPLPPGITYNKDFDPTVVLARTYDPAYAQNGHGFVDANVFQRNNTTLAYASFTDNSQYVGDSFDHHVSYQSQFKSWATGTIGKLYGLADIPQIKAGSVTSRYGTYIFDVTGAGAVVDQYGHYVPTLAKGSNSNWAFYAQTNNSFFGGSVLIDQGGLYINEAIDSTIKIKVKGFGVTSATATFQAFNTAEQVFAVFDGGQFWAGLQSTENLFMGVSSGLTVTTGIRNTALGINALQSITTGQRNVAIGTNAGETMMGDFGSVYVGFGAGASANTQIFNVGVGYNALQVSNASNNTAVGGMSFNNTSTGTRLVGVGLSSGEFNISGNDDTMVGYRAGRWNVAAGTGNVFVGNNSGEFSNDTGDANGTVGRNRNTFVGAFTGQAATGDDGVFIGYNAGIAETNSNRFILANNSNVLLYGNFSTMNLGLGTSLFGTNATKTLSIVNGASEVSTSIAHGIQIYSVDTGDATATLGLFLEQAVEAIGTFTPSNKIKVKINGTLYWIQLDAV